MERRNFNIDGGPTTAAGRVGFYLDKKGRLRELPADFDGTTIPEDAATGGVYRVVRMDEGESRLLALQIEQIKHVFSVIDWDYFATAQNDFASMAGNYDAAAVLNRNYTPEKSDLLAAQAEAMLQMLRLRSVLMKCDELRTAAADATQRLDRISAALGG